MNAVSTVQTPLGTLIRDGSFLIFFGNARGTPEELNARLPQPIRFLQQVHGDRVVECAGALEMSIKADAQWTEMKDVPLGIVTADCLPILGYCTRTQRLCAIHAGWRGVAQQIPVKAVQSAQASNETATHWRFWIGPHIHFESFEVGQDVAQRIVEQGAQCDLQAGENWLRPHSDPEKTYIDLCSIVKLQLARVGVSGIQHIPINTYTDLDYCSYRRTGKGAGRNMSWILHARDPEKILRAFRRAD